MMTLQYMELKLEELEKRIEALEQKPKTGNWITVSERLPEENKTVIASTEYGVYPAARYTKKYGKYCWEWASEAIIGCWEELECVTAWMPLPEPYK